MNRTVLSFALVAALVGGFTADGRAGDTGQCIKGASGDYKDCKAGCKEDFQTAKDACINRDHDCVEACREVRAECRDATGFDAAIKACNATRDEAIANCKQAFRGTLRLAGHLHRRRAGERLRVPVERAQEREARAEPVPQGLQELHGGLPRGRRHG